MSREEPVAGQPIALGVDCGGSSTRWRLVTADGETVAEGRTGPVSAIDLGPGGEARARLAEVAAAAAEVGRPIAVVAGVTGLDGSSTAGDDVANVLAGGLRVATTDVVVISDVVTAYLSALEPGEGVLVYAGTGSVAVHIARDGSVMRAGGHGYLIDDAGGGYWIGRQALKRLLRAADATGSAPSGPLASAVFGALGGSDWPTVRAAVYSGGRSRVAALAPAVGVAASRGDPAATAVLAEAGRELGRLVTVLLGRLGQVLPVALAGGVAAMGEHVTRSLQESLPAGAALRVATEAPVATAARLALTLAQGGEALPGLRRSTHRG